jgi:hypothetical protein
MPCKPHPADLFNGSVIANAVEWSAFTQGGGRLTRHFGSRLEARRAAQAMADQFRRPALVYAIDCNGRSAVADTIQPSQETIMTTNTNTAQVYGKRFNAQRAARKALGPDAQEDRDFRTEKRDGGWVWLAIDPVSGFADGAANAIAASDTVDVEEPTADDLGIPGFLRREKDQSEPALAEPPQVEGNEPKVEKRTAKGEPKQRAKKVGKPQPAPVKEERVTGKRAAIEEAARQGQLPTPPDFSAATHARFRAKLAKLIEMVEAGDIDGLKAYAINPVSTSPRAMARYRDLAVIALEARQNAS